MLRSTRYSAKKTGDCSRIGRHEANGLVPDSLYSAIVSCVIACRDAGSVLPLYFFWIFWTSGWISCSPREALICLTNSGIRMIRMTMTRPTMDSAQVQPDVSGHPDAVESAVWKPTMMVATTHSSGCQDRAEETRRCCPCVPNASGGVGVALPGMWIVAGRPGGPVCWRNVVDAARVPRVAAQQATPGQPGALAARRACSAPQRRTPSRTGRTGSGGRAAGTAPAGSRGPAG